jgi:DNA-binding transcriptional LysR family regulator
MNLTELRSFYLVCKYGSLAKAANFLKLSPAAISLQIKRLESELFAEIFERRPNKLLLTDKGRVLLKEANHVFDAVAKLQEAVAAGPNAYREKISIAFGRHRARIFAAPIAAFSRKHPHVRISVYSKTSAEAISMLVSGDLDIGISSLPKVPRGIQKRKLLDNKLFLIFPSGHPLAKKRAIALDDLPLYPLILHPNEETTRKLIDSSFSARGIEIENVLEVGHCESIVEFVRLGLGVGFVHGMCLPMLPRENIKWYDMTNEFGRLELSLIYKKASMGKLSHRALIEVLTRSSATSQPGL